ncbi:hypothetical protein [Streptomyces sp. NPDC005568]|uniref:hypothetical protein n=1 Tax=Streptomyces sp. NPDC005568 TaxID=3156887 RepID=UPI0033B4A559
MPSPPIAMDHFARDVLLVPRSERWRQAVSTAVLGNWCTSLLQTGHLPPTALDVLKAQAHTVNRQLVPPWRHQTRHGRVLSLDASLGEGLSLYDLVAIHASLLAHTAGGVFEDERRRRRRAGTVPSRPWWRTARAPPGRRDGRQATSRRCPGRGASRRTAGPAGEPRPLPPSTTKSQD